MPGCGLVGFSLLIQLFIADTVLHEKVFFLKFEIQATQYFYLAITGYTQPFIRPLLVLSHLN